MRGVRFYAVAIPFLWMFRGLVLAADDVAPVLTGRHLDGTNVYFDLVAWPGDYLIEKSTNLSGVWTVETNLNVGREGMVSAAVPWLGDRWLFLRAVGLTPSDGAGCLAQFQTLGSTFEPEIEFGSDSPSEFRWIWSDGTTSSDYPVASKDFGATGARVQGLLVNPLTSVKSINLGFDGSDGGDLTPLSNRPPQNVAAVRFTYPLTNLQYWASSYNPITNTLDFSGCSNLEIIECFWCTNLQHVLVSNLPALKRACFENCRLQELDLSGNPNLEDLRGAFNAYTNIVVGRGTGPNILHWCIGNNPQLIQRLQDIMTNFYSLEEVLIWNDNQSGTLKLVSTNLVVLEAKLNSYTSADLGGQNNLFYCDLPGNQLTNIILTGCSSLQYLDLHDNRLTTKTIDDLLAFLDISGPGLLYVDLTANAGFASPAGYSHYTTLTNRGVTVYVDWVKTNSVPGGTNAITFVTGSRFPHMEIRTDYGAPTSILWHWGDGAITTNSLIAEHDFGTAGRFTNYVEVVPTACVSYFGAPYGSVDQGIEGVFGLASFHQLNYLFLYHESLTSLSVAGCSNLLQLHLAGNPVSSGVCDQWFIDLDKAVTGPVTGADFWYPAESRSSASDTAWTNLVNKGYTMHPF